MNQSLRQTIENKRQKLIDQLIDADVFKIDGKQLFEVSLTKLEHEYKTVQLHAHYHEKASG
ncbi:Fur-regulated basic protein FbpA [Sporolactobacillus laevolacticus]|uniref:Fur-regulated basic protein FbpA n=1 Tax=Sporolactobacillus laevolacticus DSM 442 TaxID=1395513 RepID=V6J0G5_9BACL|nr:Fur-regulated basic protein FbpA [Sporolactobacillus laevolacticus]EST13300.1 hypothetical protein P343_00420 [Sporolactobacillus laevolacticus DSM 442]